MPEEAELAAERHADELVEWARGIAVGTGDTPAGLLRDLGLEGALADDFDSAVLDPPPPGMARVRLHGGVPSRATVEVWPAPGTLTLGMLDARLGARQELPRVHWDSPHLLAYDVRSHDPPGRCTVFARVPGGVSPERAVESVLFRTEPH